MMPDKLVIKLNNELIPFYEIEDYITISAYRAGFQSCYKHLENIIKAHQIIIKTCTHKVSLECKIAECHWSREALKSIGIE